MSQGRALTVIVFTTLALLAFAGNSILARSALLRGSIDWTSFTAVRLLSGAGVLGLLHLVRRPRGPVAGSWQGALMLFLYAALFSFAYLRLSAGTGALILFGFVQLTMLASAVRSGESPSPSQFIGIMGAAIGLVYLLLPGVSAPPLSSAALMAGAGVAWGRYSLLGRGAARPIETTTGNFVRSVPMAAALALAGLPAAHIEPLGLVLAVASGAVASALGYAIWYTALAGHTATTAAVVQLAVPVLAAVAGVLLLSEPLSLRLLFSAGLVVGGIAVATVAKRPEPKES